MTPVTQSPFFLLLLLPVLTVSNVVSATATSPASGSTITPVQHGTPTGNSTVSSVPSHQSDIPIIPTGHSSRTFAGSTTSSIVSTTSFNPSTSSQLSLRVSLFFLSFDILNLQFNSSLEDPSTNYYQELQRNISNLFSQIYEGADYLGFSIIKFRPGSVVVESALAFQAGTTNASDVEYRFVQYSANPDRNNLRISGVRVSDAPFSSSAPSGSGVPGWGIALLVLVCVLVALAVIYLVALAVHQCRRKNHGQLDVFPTRDAYHPMSEYPTYHTHGRYVPPGSTRPEEEVSAGNGGGSVFFRNEAASSADL
ncbi:mucin-1 [Trichechus manatus latirostris]|uniref:Mucin-1 n=1 Tax=Trichechus manatus latirostris TaxID=127582 RepID=A0A2Y9G3D0_TRIMA|nr:mucin-1 [Trichechus manatus latirostris]